MKHVWNESCGAGRQVLASDHWYLYPSGCLDVKRYFDDKGSRFAFGLHNKHRRQVRDVDRAYLLRKSQFDVGKRTLTTAEECGLCRCGDKLRHVEYLQSGARKRSLFAVSDTGCTIRATRRKVVPSM